VTNKTPIASAPDSAPASAPAAGQLWQQQPGKAVAGQKPANEEQGGHRVGQILEPALWMVGALLLSAILLAGIQAWRKRKVAAGDNLQDQLTQFRDAFRKGQMSKEEYQRVHALLTGRIREQIKVTEKETAKPAAEGTPHPSENGPASQENPAQGNGQP
jgi:hypothetical protein